ncbi:hypothetical protein SAMN04488065_0453 [Haloplanus vescus]|uniref:Uncharacterized protein n=1 Tax=Haloplanus vescus TaxID=555874 RepID=A0A1H3W0D4_9EURY|nr:hypothetical protein [Haloplanus vescus]SDZ80519.1 hypothetical protein SAMN04488065_0453 [Haloplanus vescus]
MVLHPFLFVPPIVALAMGVVFGDAQRRELPSRTKHLWTLGVGSLSLVGFVVVFALRGPLFRQVHLLFGWPLVVRTPYELLLWFLGIGTAFTAFLCVGYAVGSRWRVRSG